MTKRSAALTDLENQLQEITSPSGGLLETRWVSRLIELMTQTTDPDGRFLLIKILLNTNQSEKATFSRFVQLSGLEILGIWIEEVKLNTGQESKQLIQSILSTLNKISISKEVFLKTNIGTILNSLKASPDISIQVKASSILSRWEKMSNEEEANYRPREIKQEMNKKMKLEDVSSNPISEPDSNKTTLRWASEESIEAVKYFWRIDEPNAQCASLRPIPETIDTAICSTSVEDFRKKETQMEKELNRKEKSREDNIKHILENMTPKILYSNLIRIVTGKSLRPKSIQTAEMTEETKRQQSSFRVAYQRESDIPRVPHENMSYCYADSVIIPSQKMVQPLKNDMNINPPMGMPMPNMPGMITGSVMDPNYLNMMITPSMNMPMYMPKLMNANTRPINYRTEACKNFHSAAGCTHGDQCHFIHDFNYEGRPIPNMADWRKNNSIRNKNIETMKNMQMGYSMCYPPASEPHLR